MRDDDDKPDRWTALAATPAEREAETARRYAAAVAAIRAEAERLTGRKAA